VPKPVPPAVQCDTICTILMFACSQFHQGPCPEAVRFIDHDYHIIAIKSMLINCAMRLVAVDRVAP
jgi:hypothetical protein